MVSLALIFLWVPDERQQGLVYRIFFFHVPVGLISFLAFAIVFAASIAYLWKGHPLWDAVAYSTAEVGVLFATLSLASGSIWARPIWGVWWTWDPRLTTMLILWLVYIGYLMLRAYAAEDLRASRFAAVVGIIGFVDVPIVFFSIRWWRTQHPQPLLASGSDFGLTPEMTLTLLVALAALLFLFGHLVLERFAMRRMDAEVEQLRQALAAREGV
ncbi:MAG: cytochrome c biogenesis protein CcsA [Chloroflexi bacterium]|nr:cytochrome c biogenesis protein CcsA [Chloroflexota bacterium]